MVQADGPTAEQRRQVFAVQSRSHSIAIANTADDGPAVGLILPSIDDGYGYYINNCNTAKSMIFYFLFWGGGRAILMRAAVVCSKYGVRLNRVNS